MIERTTAIEKEKAYLIGVITSKNTRFQVLDNLEELVLLAETAGADPVKTIIQRLPHPHPATFIGKGKLQEIYAEITNSKVNLVIFDDELSATQQRNIEKKLKCKVLDRTHLILDIFATRAKSANAKLQVELAQYQYLLPRLSGMWSHLERQQGGIGVRGPGEREIETDRRIIRKRISFLKEQLKRIDKQKQQQRKSRTVFFRAALVGYTNAGKSSLLNLLSKADGYVENKLFATLDTMVRKVNVREKSYLLSDTVGFIRKLPHALIDSFKATLDEVREADLLIHVVDASHPQYLQHMVTVNQTLKDIQVENKPLITVFNKIDLLNMNAEELEQMVKNNNMSSQLPLLISVKEKTNIDLLNQQVLTYF
jgi:GTP-binding protein HflX